MGSQKHTTWLTNAFLLSLSHRRLLWPRDLKVGRRRAMRNKTHHASVFRASEQGCCTCSFPSFFLTFFMFKHAWLICVWPLLTAPLGHSWRQSNAPTRWGKNNKSLIVLTLLTSTLNQMWRHFGQRYRAFKFLERVSREEKLLWALSLIAASETMVFVS